MAKIFVPAGVTTPVVTGSASGVAIGNPSGVSVHLNTTDPKVDGQLVKLSLSGTFWQTCAGPP